MAKLASLFEARGFVTGGIEEGTSSGGAFATVTCRRGALEIGLIVRGDELGCPNYSDGSGFVGHDDMIGALGCAGEQELVSGHGLGYGAWYGGDAFDALRSDLECIILPVLDASEVAFLSAIAAARASIVQARGWCYFGGSLTTHFSRRASDGSSLRSRLLCSPAAKR